MVGVGEETLGQRLLAARLEAGARSRPPQRISQMAVAARVGVEQATVSKWEGDSKEPSLTALRTMAQFLGVTGGWLAFGELPKHPGDVAVAQPIAGVAQRPGVSAVEAVEAELARNQQRVAGAGPVDRASARGTPRLPGASKAKKRKRSS